LKLVYFILALTLAAPAYASIGSVTESSGAATIKRGKETIPIKLGTTVEENDKVETKNGKVKITFKDNTIVSVTESSSLVIDDFVYDPKSKAGKLGLKAAAGTVRYVSGAVAHNNPNAVKINTPTAAIAVRGTDFIMSVNEVGSSMVILMPSCEVEQNANLKGLTCGSGKIDVESGPTIISLDKPFQATLVETLGAAPTPPVIVNLSNTPLNNNLQISPPKTMNGYNVIVAARAAAEKTGDMKKEKKDDNKKEDDSKDTSDAEKQQVAQKSSDSNKEKETGTTKTTVEQVNADALLNQVAAVSVSNEDPNLKKLWKDKSETVQIGWAYDPLSPNSRNYANVVLPIDTKVQVTITQDMQTVGYNFGPNGRNTGQIVINQNFR
jgi:hypothetical protein